MIIGLGRRKESKAKVKLISGAGRLIINKQNINLFAQQNLMYQSILYKPLESLGLGDCYDIIVNARGGGKKSQLDAIQLGIARALSQINTSYRIPLKSRGYLTCDSRVKERRKYGLKKARKAPQFSKR